MAHPFRRSSFHPTFRFLVAAFCAFLMGPGDLLLLAQSQSAPPPSTTTATRPPVDTGGGTEAKTPTDKLDALVAPIALYPDPLLSQTLVASTYPLEIIQLQQWLEKNPGLKDEALVEAVQKQDWDPSVQAMAPLPDVVKMLAGDVKWCTDLGNAFLEDQGAVMDAVQRMRKKAADKGALKSGEQVKVETQTVETKTVIIIEQADPQIIYVPTYDPVVVYGPPPYYYPYPPVYYPPPYYGGAMFVSFTFGVMMGAAWHGGWGYHCGWGHNDIDININNNFVNHYDRTNNINRGGGNYTWQHDAKHRGAAPYSNTATASKYGGGTRGGATASNRAAGGARGGGGASVGTADRGGMSGGDRVGNRSTSGGSATSGGAFSGASGGKSSTYSRASSSRGSSSFGGSRGGGRGRR
jgi:hypothetical protein